MRRIHTSALMALGAVTMPAMGVGREACTRARNVASEVQQIKRCIRSDVAKLGATQFSPDDWFVTIPIQMTPDALNPATVHGEAAFSLRMENPLSKTTEWRPHPVVVMEAPTGGSPTEVELELSYSEHFVTANGSTVRYLPDQMYPGLYMRVVLLNEAGVELATRIADTQPGEVKMSLASPGTYKLRSDLVWRSGPLPPGDSNLDVPLFGVRIDVLEKPSCPADLTVDQQVDDSDFIGFAGAYNILDCADLAMPSACPADLNGDDVVDDSDFLLFAAAYDALMCD